MKLWTTLLSAVVAVPLGFGASIPGASSSPITIAYTIQRQLPPAVMTEMKKELAGLLGLPGAGPDWKDVARVQAEGVFNHLVVVHFKGVCEPRMTPPWARPVGTLGDSAVVDGKVLPFAGVDCDRIRSVLGTALSHSQERASALLGRAMARVLAHEIYHILADTTKHTRRGVTKSEFCADDLLYGDLAMEEDARAAMVNRLLPRMASR